MTDTTAFDAKRPLRRLGAVLGITTKQVLIWIGGVTPPDGTWIDLQHVPAVLHRMGATFDVWLHDGQDPKWGAYAPQIDPQTGEPWEDPDEGIGDQRAMTEIAEVARAPGALDDATGELRAVRDTLATALYKIEVSDEIRRWLVPPGHRPTCPLNGEPCTSWTCLVDVCATPEDRSQQEGDQRAP